MHNGNIVRNFECSDCHKLFLSTYNLKSHFERMHGNKNGHEFKKDEDNTKRSNRSLHKCEICDKIFYHKRHLNDHVISLHEKRKDYECSECQKSFSLTGNLKAHCKTIQYT